MPIINMVVYSENPTKEVPDVLPRRAHCQTMDTLPSAIRVEPDFQLLLWDEALLTLLVYKGLA